MKCPRCWTDKAYVRRVSPAKRLLMRLLLLAPMRCEHCYHKFVTSWFSTIGKQTRPPMLRIAPISRMAGPVCAARQKSASRRRGPAVMPSREERRRRADAA